MRKAYHQTNKLKCIKWHNCGIKGLMRHPEISSAFPDEQETADPQAPGPTCSFMDVQLGTLLSGPKWLCIRLFVFVFYSLFQLFALFMNNTLRIIYYNLFGLRSQVRVQCAKWFNPILRWWLHCNISRFIWPYTVTPSIDQTLHQFWPCYWFRPYYWIWLFT